MTDKYAALAIAEAIRKAARDLRADADAELLDAYGRDGTTQRAITIGGVKVGTYSVSAGRSSGGSVKVIDQREFDAWAEDAHPTWFHATLPEGALSVLNDGSVMDPETGELVPGVAATLVSQGMPHTTIRGCKPKDVRDALATTGIDTSALVGLLPGGDE